MVCQISNFLEIIDNAQINIPENFCLGTYLQMLGASIVRPDFKNHAIQFKCKMHLDSIGIFDYWIPLGRPLQIAKTLTIH